MNPTAHNGRLTSTVLVTTFDRPEYLRRCLTSIARQDRAADEVVVVARAGDSRTLTLLAGWKLSSGMPLKTVTVAVPGILPALRTGLAACGGDVVCVLDDDAEARSDWLSVIISTFERRENVGLVGGKIVPTYYGEVRYSDARPCANHVVGHVSWLYHIAARMYLPLLDPEDDRVAAVDCAMGSNLSVRRSAVRGKVLARGLRPLRGEHWEVDLCHTVKHAGLGCVFIARATVTHHDEAPRSTSAPESEAFNHVLLALRWLRGIRRLVVLLYWVLIGSRRSPGVMFPGSGSLDLRRRCLQQRIAALLSPEWR